jgi:YD repeat-containing protein
MYALRWNGSGFSQIRLPINHDWDMRFPEQFELFEVFDYNGDGLDDILIFSGGRLRIFVREGNKADMLTSVVDGLGAQTTIVYAPISDTVVHTPTYGAVFPKRATASKVWVVREYLQDDGIGSVNTHRYQYFGGLRDVTGLGFLGFKQRTTTHVESGITTTSTYMPDFIGFGGIYPLLGLPTVEVTRAPIGPTAVQITTTDTTYAIRPAPIGTCSLFRFPLTIVEETIEINGSIPTMPARRRTITQDMDAFGNRTTYNEVWSDGNKFTSASTYSTNPSTWLVGLLTDVTEQSTTPNGQTQIRNRAYEYDAQGLLSREIIEPGQKTSEGYLPLGPQPDGVQTMYRTFDRYRTGMCARLSKKRALGHRAQAVDDIPLR